MWLEVNRRKERDSDRQGEIEIIVAEAPLPGCGVEMPRPR